MHTDMQSIKQHEQIKMENNIKNVTSKNKIIEGKNGFSANRISRRESLIHILKIILYIFGYIFVAGIFFRVIILPFLWINIFDESAQWGIVFLYIYINIAILTAIIMSVYIKILSYRLQDINISGIWAYRAGYIFLGLIFIINCISIFQNHGVIYNPHANVIHLVYALGYFFILTITILLLPGNAKANNFGSIPKKSESNLPWFPLDKTFLISSLIVTTFVSCIKLFLE